MPFSEQRRSKENHKKAQNFTTLFCDLVPFCVYFSSAGINPPKDQPSAPRIAAAMQFATSPPARAAIAIPKLTGSGGSGNRYRIIEERINPNEIGSCSCSPDQDLRHQHNRHCSLDGLADTVSAITPADSSP